MIAVALVLPYRWKVCAERIASTLIPVEQVVVVDPTFVWVNEHASPYAAVAVLYGRLENRSSHTLTQVEVETEPSLGFANCYVWLTVPAGGKRDFYHYVYFKPERRQTWPASTPEALSLLSRWRGVPPPRAKYTPGAFPMRIDARIVGTTGEASTEGIRGR